MAISSKDIETLWGRYQTVEDQQSCPAPSSNDKTMVQGHVRKDSVTVAHVNICLSNGMRIDHHKLSYSELLSFIQKLEPLCLV